MNTVNRIFLVGRVGRDPEWKEYGSEGKGLCRFSVATDRPGKDDTPDWHDITAFGQSAVFVREYVQKGDLVHIEGRQENKKRSDGDGKGYWPGVVADRVTALPSKTRIERELETSDPPKDAKPYDGPDLPF